MMASVAKEPFDHPDWIFETKLDGFRAIAVIDSTGRARIWSRNRLPLEPKFPSIRDATEELKLRSTVLDGEIVALDEEGIPRRGRLQELVTPVDGIQVAATLEKRGIALFRLAKEKGLEGIIAKRKRSMYQPGQRSPDWLKIKSRPQQEFVVGGFTEGKGSRKHFGALLLGAYRDGKLRYFGHSGSGFTEKGLKEAVDRLKPFFTDKSPFVNPPKIPEKIQWVKPALVCEVAFAEWTQDGELRQTTFLGWRDDKSSEQVVLE